MMSLQIGYLSSYMTKAMVYSKKIKLDDYIDS